MRLVAPELSLDRTQRKIRRRNAGLTTHVQPSIATDEQFRLFRRYQLARHQDSEMAHMSREDYAGMVQDGAFAAEMIELREEGRLIGVMLVDRVEEGLSAIYSFFEPDRPRLSLGVELIFRTADVVVERGDRHVYLGYWIEKCGKMAYKTRFRPLERLEGGAWLPDPETDQEPSAS